MWDVMQNLPPAELLRYKETVPVHFGYDRKDGQPTTYRFVLDVADIVLHFSGEEEGPPAGGGRGVADVVCSHLTWSMTKLGDWITRQRLTCGSISLVQTSGREEWGRYEELLGPLRDGADVDADADPVEADACARLEPELIYESTSRMNGDNVRSLEIWHACINFIYPAWMHVMGFFRDTPEPDVWTTADVKSSMQVGDRWYKINGAGRGRGGGFGCERDGSVGEGTAAEMNRGSGRGEAETDRQPSYQFRLVLVSPVSSWSPTCPRSAGRAMCAGS